MNRAELTALVACWGFTVTRVDELSYETRVFLLSDPKWETTKTMETRLTEVRRECEQRRNFGSPRFEVRMETRRHLIDQPT